MQTKRTVLLLLSLSAALTGLWSQPTPAQVDSLSHLFYQPPREVTREMRLSAAVKIHHYYVARNPDSIITIANGVERIGRTLGDSNWVHHAGYFKASYYFMTGNNRAAFEAIKILIKNTEPHDSLHVFGWSHLGLLYNKEHQLDSAMAAYQYALRLAQQYHPGNAFGHFLQVLYYDIAEIYSKKGQYVEALEYYQKGKEGMSVRVKRYGAAHMGIIYKKLGLMEEARASFEEAKQYPANQSNRSAYIRNLRLLMYAAPDLTEVQTLLDEGVALARQHRLPILELAHNLAAGKIFLDSLRLEAARRCLEQAGVLASRTQSETDRLESALYLAKIDMLQGAHTRALKVCRRILPAMEKNNSLYEMLVLYEVLSQSYEAAGRADSALFYLKKKWAVDAQVNNRDALKKSIGAFLSYKNKQEQAALQTAKEYAENMAAVTRSRMQVMVGFAVLVILLLGGIVFLYRHFYRKKENLANSLAISNRNLLAEQTALKRANQQMARFSSVISHDMLSNLDLMLSTGHVFNPDQKWSGAMRQYFEMTQNTSRQLKTYCLGLLEQLQSERLRLSAPVDPMPLVQQVLKRFEASFRDKGFEINLQSLSPVLLPAVVIEQIFQNLLSNALKYADTATRPRLRIGEERPGVWVISDNGPGIAPERLARLFQQPETPTDRGQGIGLYWLKKTLEAHSADIRVENQAEGGARWIIKAES